MNHNRVENLQRPDIYVTAVNVLRSECGLFNYNGRVLLSDVAAFALALQNAAKKSDDNEPTDMDEGK